MAVEGEITALLRRAQRGDTQAEGRLLDLLYRELRHMAAALLARERKDHTLQPTALVNEAYLRLGLDREADWQNRTHLMAAAARAMRHVLVDCARAKAAEKRGGRARQVELNEGTMKVETSLDELVVLDQALNRLQEFDPRQARIVEMKFFAGMSDEQTGEALGISARTVKREWRAARAWLYAELTEKRPSANSAAAGEGNR